jgi:hypothetical protein
MSNYNVNPHRLNLYTSFPPFPDATRKAEANAVLAMLVIVARKLDQNLDVPFDKDKVQAVLVEAATSPGAVRTRGDEPEMDLLFDLATNPFLRPGVGFHWLQTNKFIDRGEDGSGPITILEAGLEALSRFLLPTPPKGADEVG